jgi:sarcosine oxidase, subunit gamma
MLEKNFIARRRPPLSSVANPDVKLDQADRTGALTIRPLLAEARWSLRIPEPAVVKWPVLAGFQLQRPINRFASDDNRSAARLGPDEWLLTAPEADSEMIAAEIAAALAATGQHHALVDISHRNIALVVAGVHAAQVLNAGCPLDLHTDRFPVGMATRTVFGRCEILLFRIADVAYRIECWRSFAPYVSALLAESAQEFSVAQ